MRFLIISQYFITSSGKRCNRVQYNLIIKISEQQSITNNIMEKQDLICDSHCLKTNVLIYSVSVSVYMARHLSVLPPSIFWIISVILFISHAHRLLLSPEVWEFWFCYYLSCKSWIQCFERTKDKKNFINEIISIISKPGECRTMTTVERLLLASQSNTSAEAFVCEKADVATA